MAFLMMMALRFNMMMLLWEKPEAMTGKAHRTT